MNTADQPEQNIETKMSVKHHVDDVRMIPVPAYRCLPLKENWLKIYTPITEQLKLQIRFYVKTRYMEIRTVPETPDISYLQKAADFVKAFICGFEVEDASALLRRDNLFMESFEIHDVRQRIKGNHQSRAIGRLVGKDGETKYTIENMTKTKIVLADTQIHILGSYQNIQLARRAISNLILGRPSTKVYQQLRNAVNKISKRF